MILTKQQELEVYEESLADWEKSKKMNPKERNLHYVDNGLCFYFRCLHGIEISDDYGTQNLAITALIENNLRGAYIAKKGLPEPRIALLKQAIEIITKQIEDGNK